MLKIARAAFAALILACFAQVPEFRREFGAYRPLVDLEHFRVYQRIT